MISKAEQQIIIKLQDLSKLEEQYKLHVHSKEKLKPAEATEFNSTLILADINKLGVDCVCDFVEGVWEITLGGKATKKKVNMKGENLATLMAKSLIIYARKYL